MITKVNNSVNGTANQMPLIPKISGRQVKFRDKITMPRNTVKIVAGRNDSML